MDHNPLRELNRVGQSVWLDNIRRGELLSGEMKRLIDEDGVSGVTSNPSIFEKAIAGSKDYDAAITKLVGEGLSGAPLFERLEVEDIQMAADLFRPTYNRSKGQDGYVSLEVAPDLAHDTEATMAQARRLWQTVNRPNILVKIPGTKEGLPAIEQCLAEGININITLLFAQERYEEVAYAYIAALERRVREGKPIDRIGSVASFFVSRIDTLVDQQLEAKLREAKTPAERDKITALLGKAAIANAKAAYEKFKAIFGSERFRALAAKGARVERVLWASTSTKNPKYRDVLYAEELIGPDTVDTLPPATVSAFRDHGKVRLSLEEDLAGAHRVLQQLAEVGVSLQAATQQLEDEGVASFTRDFEKLLKALAEKRSAILASAGAVA
jgi:transaldolase